MKAEKPEKAVHICHLTVLNPARHSRIYEKEAVSQAKAGYQVTVLGQGSGIPTEENPSLQFTGEFGRLSPQRFFARKKIFRMARELQADIYIVHTPELLEVGKQLKKHDPDCKVIYDMHEDYPKNIQFGGHYPALLRNLLAGWVHKKETEAVQWLDGVWFAERCFQGQLPIARKKTITVENKFIPPPNFPLDQQVPMSPPLKLVFTGTVAENWGVFRCLEFAKALHAVTPVQLTLIGQVHSQELVQKIRFWILQADMKDQVHLRISPKYVSHRELLEAIHQSHAGLAFYRIQRHIKGRIPTKFYEHLALKRPLLFTDTPDWNALNEQWGLGVPVRFPLDSSQNESILQQLSYSIWTPQAGPEVWSWEPEAKKMLEFLAKVGGEQL